MTKDDIILYVYNNKEVEKYCRHFTGEWEELKSELIGQLLKKKESDLQLMYDKKYLIYTCFTISKRIFYGNISGTGIFRNKYIENKLNIFSVDINNLMFKMDYLVDNDKSIDNGFKLEFDFQSYNSGNVNSVIIDYIDELLRDLHWYDMTLFNYYYKDGYKLREISELTGIKKSSIHENIKKTKNYIKEMIKNNRERWEC